MKRIYVGNLSRQVSEEALEAAFAAFGEVRSVSIVKDRDTGQSRGFGFVEMNDTEAAAAITGLNGQNLDGRALNVNEAKPKAAGGGSGRGRGRPD
jgi:RNA recognition motif-containing protein